MVTLSYVTINYCMKYGMRYGKLNYTVSTVVHLIYALYGNYGNYELII